MTKETYILMTKDTAVFLADYGFHTWDIIRTEEDGTAINKIDITSWVHEFKDLNIKPEDVQDCRVDLKEFIKKHKAMYKKWKGLSHGWRTEEERKSQEEEQQNLFMPLHDWLESHPISHDTAVILDNEVYKQHCYECDNYIEEDEEIYIQELGEPMCISCATDKMRAKYPYLEWDR